MRYIVVAFLAVGVAGTVLIQSAAAAKDPKGKASRVVAPTAQTRGNSHVNRGDCGHDFHLCPK
jgi:hypothetical protein